MKKASLWNRRGSVRIEKLTIRKINLISMVSMITERIRRCISSDLNIYRILIWFNCKIIKIIFISFITIFHDFEICWEDIQLTTAYLKIRHPLALNTKTKTIWKFSDRRMIINSKFHFVFLSSISLIYCF